MKKFLSSYVKSARQEGPVVRFILLYVFPLVLFAFFFLAYGSIFGVLFPETNVLYAHVKATGPFGHNAGLVFGVLFVAAFFLGATDRFPARFGNYQGAGESFACLVLLFLSIASYAGFWTANIH